MKNFFVLIGLLFLISQSSMAQGGFGGVTLKPERISGQNLMLFGGGGAWVISEHFYLGGSGFGSSNTVLIKGEALESLGFGGVMVGYFKNMGNGARLGAQMNAGSGGYTLEGESGSFRFMEPGINGWYRINDFMNVNLGLNYRVAFTNVSDPLNDNDLSNFSISLSLYFGYFK